MLLKGKLRTQGHQLTLNQAKLPKGKLRTQGRQIMGKTARMIRNMMAFGTAFTPTSQTSMVS